MTQRENFIPCSRQEIIELCLAEGKLSKQEESQFRDFCNILIAYYHFKFHHYLEKIKASFVPFNPEISQDNNMNLAQEKIMGQELIDNFIKVLEKANYRYLSKHDLTKAFAENSLFDLKTEVNFSDFERVLCYTRGDSHQKISVRKLWRKIDKRLDIFEQVILLIKFKDKKYFQNQSLKLENLKFKPGKVYLYLYKNISKSDIEFIFPNIKMSMTWKDRIIFGVPAIGAGISLIARILPQLLLIIGVIIYVTLGQQPIEQLQVEEEEVRNITPLLVTIFSLILTLGGFAFKQYTNYQNKQLKFRKTVTETLFFRNMASNTGVFQYLIDTAEEEECKEIILVYYHLLTSQQPFTSSKLDRYIETWMENKLDKKVNFDIENTLQSLEAIQGKLGTESELISLLKRDSDNYCQVVPLAQAKQIIDNVWDNTFLYN
ncbi:MAG: TMEM143 family protein [Xenococcus sp. (in: cyanobacteria)]